MKQGAGAGPKRIVQYTLPKVPLRRVDNCNLEGSHACVWQACIISAVPVI
jgi:hypothetical protein